MTTGRRSQEGHSTRQGSPLLYGTGPQRGSPGIPRTESAHGTPGWAQTSFAPSAARPSIAGLDAQGCADLTAQQRISGESIQTTGQQNTLEVAGRTNQRSGTCAKHAEYRLRAEATAGSALGTATSAGTQPVYALSVEGQHEYFANGLLVKNCDSALYGWRWAYNYLSQPLPEIPERGTAEYLDWRAKQDDLESIRLAQEEERRARMFYGTLIPPGR